MNLIFVILFLFCSVSLHARVMDEVQYSLATADAQKNNWEQAEQRINKLLVNSPDRPDLLYDAGVVAYRNKKFEQARACFEHGLQCSDIKPSLQEQLCFNAGNTCVDLQQLKEAITYYEKVLSLNNKHERARHNLEVVKNMLKQQEEQNKQQQEQKNNQKNNEQQKQDQQQNNPNNNESDQKQQKQNQNTNNQNKEQKSQEQQAKNNQGEQNKQQSESKNQSKQQQEKQNEQENSSQQQNKRQREQGGNQPEERKPSQHSQGEQQQKEHTDPQSHKQLPSQDKQKLAAAQGKKDLDKASSDVKGQSRPAGFDKNEQWMLQLLQEQEKADKQANKQILHGLVQKNLAGHDGQNCW